MAPGKNVVLLVSLLASYKQWLAVLGTQQIFANKYLWKLNVLNKQTNISCPSF